MVRVTSYALRITSTYVEKTIFRCVKWCPLQDHLHLRGENSLKEVNGTSEVGSPPLTWRKPTFTDKELGYMGITSTYVEKTHCETSWNIMKQDHLHLRGENFFVSSFSGVISGSPPLTWRKHKLKQLKAKLTGITSTYVEKTNGTKVLTDADKDHLHLRGENSRILSCI